MVNTQVFSFKFNTSTFFSNWRQWKQFFAVLLQKNTFQHDTERLCAIKKTKMYNPFSSGLQYTLTPLISLAG